MLSGLPRTTDPRILVDHATADDAGVFRLDPRTALVQTVDFFTPVVDDPEAFGAIAAANAVSDVYAMGGRPLTALSIAAIPERDFPLEWASAMFRGGHAKLAEAGCVLVGGHTIRDPEIKFGYAVTGLVDPDALITNAAGRAGDRLVLTKPLGTGVIATALKASRAPDEAVAAATESMLRLNAAAAEAARRAGVRAGTDVTGFGLAGHAAALARHSGVRIELDPEALPLLPGALALASDHQPGGLAANRREFGPMLECPRGLDPALETLVFDPQTSGGLLLMVSEDQVDRLVSAVVGAVVVGRARPAAGAPLALVYGARRL